MWVNSAEKSGQTVGKEPIVATECVIPDRIFAEIRYGIGALGELGIPGNFPLQPIPDAIETHD
jgi:hypothetical protein